VSRIKTSAFWILVIIALCVGVYAYFHLKNNKKPQLEALTVLPDNCLIYLNTNDFFEFNKKLNSQSLIADKLKLFGDINNFCGAIQTIDSLLNSDEDMRDFVKNNVVHFGYYKEKQGWMAALNIKQLGEETAIAEQLATILKATKTKANIYVFKLNGFAMYFNMNEGVTTLSNRQELIIQSLNKKTAKLSANRAFIQFKSTLTENSLLSVYVDHTLYSDSKTPDNLNLTYVTKKGFSAGAIDIQPSQLKINGYVIPEESEMLSLFSEQEPQISNDAINYLPLNTKFFKAFGFSSYPDLRIGFPLTNIHIKYWIKANERGLYNVEDDFNGNILNNVIDFETSLSARKFISVEVNDTLKASENLKFMSDSTLKQDSLLIYRLNDSIEMPLRLFIPLSETPTNYAVLYQSHIFFSTQSSDLLLLVRDLKSNNLLLNNESFAAYKNQNFPDDFNYLIYGAPNQIGETISNFFNFKTSSEKDPFENFRHFSFAVTNKDKQLKFRFHLMNETENANKEQNVLWTLKLDSASTTPAYGFVNHLTGENEIVVQDNSNVLYLINAKGSILWKRKLNEKILSAIYTADIYKKNKYQLLFNTKNYLHLIDRNGNYVEKYPVKLPAAASNEMSLFDYDNNKDYRLFIACQNNSIYNYSIHGLLQEKFTTVKTENEVRLPVQYVKVGASDYLVALDQEGKIYTFSRKGAARIGLRNWANINCTSFYTDAGNSVASTYLIYVDDKNGLINKISFEDKKEIVKLHSDAENAFVTFALVDDNRSMDLIASKGSAFQAYNFSGNLILEKPSEIPLGKTNFYSDESHSVFYSLSEDKTQVIVFDQVKSRTKLFKANALPLISNLFNDNKKYLILTNGDHLTCALLN